MATKNIILIAIFLLSLHVFGKAQTWEWAKSVGDMQLEKSNCIASDHNGNTYIVGSFTSPTLTVGTITLYNSSNTGEVFLVKYDPTGNVIWAKSAAGYNNDDALGLAIDPIGNVFIVGIFTSPTITFDTIVLTSSTINRPFIVKYDPFGNVIWAKAPGGNGNNIGLGVSTDASGNAFITGSFSGSIIFDSYVLNNPMSGPHIFIAKLDSTGTTLWAKSSSGLNGGDRGNRVVTDTDGNVLLVGSFKSTTISFDGITLTNSGNTGLADICLVKYDSNGNVVWAKSAGGGSHYDEGHSVSVDVSGDVYITGYFMSPTITFGTTILINSGSNDIFVTKYSSTGSFLWAKSIGSLPGETAGDIITDGASNLFVTGSFSNSITIESNTLVSAGGNDIFLLKYTSSGSLMWASSYGGTGNEYSRGLSVFAGSLFITGIFSSSVLTFGSFNMNNAGNYDAFVASLSMVTKTDQEEIQTEVVIYPNPINNQATIIFSSPQKNSIIRLTDILGQEIKQINFTGSELTIDLEAIKSGIYFVRIIDTDNVLTSKKILIQ